MSYIVENGVYLSEDKYRTEVSFNDSGDVKLVDCNCPDYKFRMAFYNIESGFSDAENPGSPKNLNENYLNLTKPLLCKHLKKLIKEVKEV